MDKILIIGAGFAGLSAASRLRRLGLAERVTLVDKRKTSDFLPMLPDCLGRGIEPDILSYDLESAVRRLGSEFVNDRIGSLDLSKKRAVGDNGEYACDHLIVASGAQTNFYGNRSFEEQAFGLVSSQDARKLSAVLKKESFDYLIVSGGGYTGIEAATNLKLYLNKTGAKSQVVIVEKADRILKGLPEWMQAYTEKNLALMGIAVLARSVIEKIEGRVVTVAGKKFDNALVVWASGVAAPQFARDLAVEKNAQGRIKVDEFLRFADNCYAIGDAGYFCRDPECLRMAVQFSIAQGTVAAQNIFRSIKGRRSRRFIPIDLGYIVPMANNRSCGTITGINLRGFLPTVLHYLMCAYRIQGARRKAGILWQLFSRGCQTSCKAVAH